MCYRLKQTSCLVSFRGKIVKVFKVGLVIGFIFSSSVPAVAQYPPINQIYNNYNYCNQPQYYHHPSCYQQRRRQTIRRVKYQRIDVYQTNHGQQIVPQGKSIYCSDIRPLPNGLTRCFNPH
jgi:hypothetical protein